LACWQFDSLGFLRSSHGSFTFGQRFDVGGSTRHTNRSDLIAHDILISVAPERETEVWLSCVDPTSCPTRIAAPLFSTKRVSSCAFIGNATISALQHSSSLSYYPLLSHHEIQPLAIDPPPFALSDGCPCQFHPIRLFSAPTGQSFGTNSVPPQKQQLWQSAGRR